LRDFLRQSVRGSSAGVYGNGWKKWLSYLLTLEGRSHPGERMERVAGADERAERLVLFYQYLYKALGQRDEQVATISSALRFEFETRGVNAEFFGLPLAVAGRKACKRMVDEKRVRGEELEATSILPLGIEAAQGMRKELWEGIGWGTAKELTKRGAWIAMCLGFDSGDRVSNLTKPDKKGASDHCLKAGDVVFEVEDVRTGGVIFLRGGEELRGYLAGSAGYRVVAVDITYHTSKTVGKKSVLRACGMRCRRGRSNRRPRGVGDMIGGQGC
jgi:hypothetical protein